MLGTPSARELAARLGLLTRAVEEACLRERALAVARHRREGKAS